MINYTGMAVAFRQLRTPPASPWRSAKPLPSMDSGLSPTATRHRCSGSVNLSNCQFFETDQIYLKHTSNMPQIYLKHTLNIPQIYLPKVFHTDSNFLTSLPPLDQAYCV